MWSERHCKLPVILFSQPAELILQIKQFGLSLFYVERLAVDIELQLDWGRLSNVVLLEANGMFSSALL